VSKEEIKTSVRLRGGKGRSGRRKERFVFSETRAHTPTYRRRRLAESITTCQDETKAMQHNKGTT